MFIILVGFWSVTYLLNWVADKLSKLVSLRLVFLERVQSSFRLHNNLLRLAYLEPAILPPIYSPNEVIPVCRSHPPKPFEHKIC